MKSLMSSRVPVESLGIFETATRLVARVSSNKFNGELIRCHELARAVGKVLNLEVVDGVFGSTSSATFEHSWLRVPGDSILDVYAIGQEPMVQLVADRVAKVNYRPHLERGDIRHDVVGHLVGEMQETIRRMPMSLAGDMDSEFVWFVLFMGDNIAPMKIYPFADFQSASVLADYLKPNWSGVYLCRLFGEGHLPDREQEELQRLRRWAAREGWEDQVPLSHYEQLEQQLKNVYDEFAEFKQDVARMLGIGQDEEIQAAALRLRDNLDAIRKEWSIRPKWEVLIYSGWAEKFTDLVNGGEELAKWIEAQDA